MAETKHGKVLCCWSSTSAQWRTIEQAPIPPQSVHAALDVDLATWPEISLENLAIIACAGDDVARPIRLQAYLFAALERFQTEQPFDGRGPGWKDVPCNWNDQHRSPRQRW